VADLTFAAFSAANRKRCEEGFKRKLGTRDAVVSMAIGLAEEAGEVSGAVRAYLGISERKERSAEKVGHEIADLVSYADLLAQSCGMTLEAVLVEKFNIVSARIGSAIRIDSDAICTTCTSNIPPHTRGVSCDAVFYNPPGALCGLCDGTSEHEHRGRQS
jgi:NTP pyrophosphatase (non-canonical NTP hydrolase)